MANFVVLEGIDGSGSTTIANRLWQELTHLDIPAVLTKEPSNGPIGKLARAALLGEFPLDRRAMLGLFVADRWWHVDNVIKPALDRGDWVVCDRYFPSTIVYQSDLFSRSTILSTMQDVLLPDNANSTVFTFDNPIRAFGADWNLFGPGGAGIGIQVSIDGMLVSELDNELGNPKSILAAAPDGEFFGFVNSDPFTMLTLTGGTQTQNASRETYSLDNAAFSPVPEPSAVLVFGSGLIVTGLAIRRRPR